MASQDASVQVAGSPVSGEGGGMQQCLQDTDHPVIVQLQAVDAALSDNGRLGERRRLPGVDRTRQ